MTPPSSFQLNCHLLECINRLERTLSGWECHRVEHRRHVPCGAAEEVIKTFQIRSAQCVWHNCFSSEYLNDFISVLIVGPSDTSRWGCGFTVDWGASAPTCDGVTDVDKRTLTLCPFIDNGLIISQFTDTNVHAVWGWVSPAHHTGNCLVCKRECGFYPEIITQSNKKDASGYKLKSITWNNKM